MHRDECSESFQDSEWDSKSKVEASSLLLALTLFNFIICFKIVYIFWSHLAGITVKLQRRCMDIINAYKEVDVVKKCYRN